MGCRIKQKGEKDFGGGCSQCVQDLMKVGSGGGEPRPQRNGVDRCGPEARALTGGDVKEGPLGGREAAGDLAGASRVITPVPSQPASTITTTSHS